MKIAAKLQYLGILASLLLTSCSGITTIKSPNEDGGLGGNQDQDVVEKKDVETLKNFLNEVAKNEYYSYEVNARISLTSTHFKSYYTPNAFYEKNDDSNFSIGYAQNVKTKELFKFRMNEDMSEVYPSLFVYSSLGSNKKVKNLYNAIETIPNFTFLIDSMESFSAEHVSGNKYLITDPVVSSIFQYMTSYGTSIQEFVTAVYIEIIDIENLIFKSTVELGTMGSFTSLYTKDDVAPLLPIENKIKLGTIDGCDYYTDVKDFFDLTMSNNYKIEGIFEKMTTGQQTKYPQNYYCTNDYFYIEYLDDYAQSFHNWGYVLVPAGKTITYYDFVNDKKGTAHTQTLEYDACYRFREYENSYVFDFFKGPVETNGVKFIKVDQLPSVGNENVFYILFNEETNENEVYVYVQDSQGVYSYTLYSSWFDTVGDFYINDQAATFYLSSTAVGPCGANYFEKTIGEDNSYFTKDAAVLTDLSNSLFGWGWIDTNTWMDYCIGANLDIQKNKNGEISSANLGVEIELKNEIKEMYYTFKDFGTTSVPEVEEFLKGVLN